MPIHVRQNSYGIVTHVNKINFISQLIFEILLSDFLKSWNLRWEVKNHNNSPFRQFLEKLNNEIWKRKKKKKGKKLYLGLFFCPNMSKIKLSTKTRLCQFLDHPIMYITSGKNQKKVKGSKGKYWTPYQPKDEWETDHSFHRPLCLQTPIYKESLTIFMAIFYLLDILLILLKYFGHFHLCQTKSNWFAKYYSFVWR